MNQRAMMQIRKMQKDMMEAQKRIEEGTYTGTAGGGIVTVTMNGKHEILKVTIDPEAFESKDDIEMIEDAICAASRDCLKQIEKVTEEEMAPFSALTGAMGGLF